MLVTATARHIRTERYDFQSYAILDDNTGQKVAHVNIERGFAIVQGTRGSAFEGLAATVGGGMPGLRQALAEGLRNGRDDRR